MFISELSYTKDTKLVLVKPLDLTPDSRRSVLTSRTHRKWIPSEMKAGISISYLRVSNINCKDLFQWTFSKEV